MVIGIPVIASAVDGILDLIQNKKTGILVQPDNVTDLVSAICEIIENPDLANTIGLAGQKYIQEYCSPERVGKQFVSFYGHILKCNS
jgi:glycosyltransferase involved in cell wall biosynthesis